jgi:hypothetical protein
LINFVLSPFFPGSCSNNHRNDKECDTWAKYGHCKINKWMTIHCAKSCGECKSEAVTTPKPDKKGKDIIL